MKKQKHANVILNGRFLAAPRTGVQRVAGEMIRALDEIDQSGSSRFELDTVKLIIPTNADIAKLKLSSIQASKIGYFRGLAWEQFDLLRLARKTLIINLANFGPVLSPNAVTMIHDAQTFSVPSSYSRAFRFWYGCFQPIFGRRNRRILTVSHFSKLELVKHGIATESKIDVIHNGADHIGRISSNSNAARCLGLEPKTFVLGLANLQPHKNISILLKAFDDQRLADIYLVLFGNVKADELEKLTGKNLPPNVRVIGPVSDEFLKGLMESALCLAFPSRTEGFGLPPLEAMFVGCPAIVTRCGALPEICGDAAVYADPDNCQEWVETILVLAQDPEVWRNRSESGKARAAKFRWRNSAIRLLEIIEPYR